MSIWTTMNPPKNKVAHSAASRMLIDDPSRADQKLPSKDPYPYRASQKRWMDTRT
jgi:hypothetical protein